MYDHTSFSTKSRKLNTMEPFHIYEAIKTGKQLNEQYTEKHKPSLKQS
jgi:hypothetical protein